ncbi:MAG: glutamine--fructose-6-phosphate transaminase (isomerizing), partial [Gammaproteobacteria bacterium]|nr:glutamine--fructose-6-phosphate transaminase (isomerizing) [Gammaproteobacteria bacterium]
NGIIENYKPLRDELKKAGYTFASDTDTETIAHLVHHELQQTSDFLKAIQSVSSKLKGTYALAIISTKHPDCIAVVRLGSPLVIGLGIGENFIASDSLALLPVTNRFIYLEEGDVAGIYRDRVIIYDKNSRPVDREIHTTDTSIEAVNKSSYRHFMLKEIFEQAEVVEASLENRITSDKVLAASFGIQAPKLFEQTKRIQIVACGSSYHAGLVARHWFEEYAGIPCDVDIASEFRYRKKIIEPNTLFVTISQSGETADTLAALRQAKELGYLSTLTICNVPESSLVRESELIFITRAGKEIGVASTKAFTAQLIGLLMLVLVFSERHQSAKEQQRFLQLLKSLPQLIRKALTLSPQIKTLAETFMHKDHALFLGRGSEYPIACEGALKLKEISYIHAEAYPAGELKHGPLALIDEEMPVIAVAPNNHLLEKLKSNLKEVQARGGQLIIFSDSASGIEKEEQITNIEMPAVDKMIAPIIYTIPLQLLSYYVALLKGTDVDQPRNLAKSVTVE